MINSYLTLTVIAEWCAFISAGFLLDKKTGDWRLFTMLLLAGVCTETAGWYMYHAWKIYNNALPFNLLMIISTLIFIYIFSKAPSLQASKRWLHLSVIIFLFFAIINLFFFQGFTRYNAFSESLGDIILSLISCYFLFTIIKADHPVNLLNLDYFWLANGVLFYSLGSALIYHFSYVLENYYNHTGINVGEYINYALNLILYSTLIISFICRRKATR